MGRSWEGYGMDSQGQMRQAGTTRKYHSMQGSCTGSRTVGGHVTTDYMTFEHVQNHEKVMGRVWNGLTRSNEASWDNEKVARYAGQLHGVTNGQQASGDRLRDI
jgi:hypothetical protein